MIKPTTEPTSQTAHTAPATESASAPQAVTLSLQHIASFCAAGIILCFFLPWIAILFGKLSGFELTKLDQRLLLLWLVPLFSLLTIVGGFIGKSQRTAAQLAGVAPLVVLGLGLYDMGQELLKAIDVAGWASLGLALVLLSLSRNLTK